MKKKLPQRHRSHVQQKESRLFVERVLPTEWKINVEAKDGESSDYGLDLAIEIIENENVTGAHFLMQLKSKDKLVINKKGFISHPCKTSTLQYFLERPELVIYIVYDIVNDVGYWIWVQEFLRNQPSLSWKKQKKFTVKIPKENILNEHSIEKIKNRVLKNHKREKITNAIETLNHPGIKYGVEFNENNTIIKTSPKYLGAEQDYPLKLELALSFDESEEGKKAKKSWEDAFKKGIPTEIKPQFIKEFKIPKELDFEGLLFDNEFKPDGLIIQPLKRDRELLARLEILNEDNLLVAQIPYIEFKEVRYGEDEVLMSNTEQPIPQKFSILVNIPKRESTLSFNLQHINWNVSLVKEVFHLQQALALGGKLHLVHINTGTILIDKVFSKNLISKPSNSLVEIANDLVIIQQRLKISIQWPNKILLRDYYSIKNIISIITTGETLMGGSINLIFDKSAAKKFSETFLNKKDINLMIEGESDSIDLFNQKIEFGRARILLKSASLTKKTIQTLSSIEILNDVSNISVEIETNKDIVIQYIDWVPENK